MLYLVTIFYKRLGIYTFGPISIVVFTVSPQIIPRLVTSLGLILIQISQKY